MEAIVTDVLPFVAISSATISALACPSLSIAECTASLCGVAFREFFLRMPVNSSMFGLLRPVIIS